MEPSGPTVPPPHPETLNTALYRNIGALERHHQEQLRAASFHQRLAHRITRFAGSFAFIYIHLALFGSWIVANLGWIPGIVAWDRQFVVLAMAASIEAIFLSTFVLISQNRMAEMQGRQAALDLQVSLLAEHEVTRLIRQTSAIAEKLGVAFDDDVEELKRDIAPEAVLHAIEDAEVGA
jgi:uncharacterized membrane protein